MNQKCFPKDDKSKLDLYSDIFIEAVRSRASKNKILFLSSGWDSTSILATLVHLFGPSKIDCVIGRMRYKRSEIINQFEIDRAKKWLNILQLTSYKTGLLRMHQIQLSLHNF